MSCCRIVHQNAVHRACPSLAPAGLATPARSFASPTARMVRATATTAGRTPRPTSRTPPDLTGSRLEATVCRAKRTMRRAPSTPSMLSPPWMPQLTLRTHAHHLTLSMPSTRLVTSTQQRTRHPLRTHSTRGSAPQDSISAEAFASMTPHRWRAVSGARCAPRQRTLSRHARPGHAVSRARPGFTFAEVPVWTVYLSHRAVAPARPAPSR